MLATVIVAAFAVARAAAARATVPARAAAPPPTVPIVVLKDGRSGSTVFAKLLKMVAPKSVELEVPAAQN